MQANAQANAQGGGNAQASANAQVICQVQHGWTVFFPQFDIETNGLN